LTHKGDALGAKVHSVVEGSCGLDAGLSHGDNIIAIDDIRVTSAELDQTVAEIPLGETIKVSYFRRERLYHVSCKLSASHDNTCYLSYKDRPTEKLLAWLY
jgi:predicted metalloprotease with PDZ domain